jgi:glycosyltransferase involved in cell wall biosynthesis
MERNDGVFEPGAEVIAREAALFVPEIFHANQFCYGAVDLPVPKIITAHSDVLSWARACRTAPLRETPWLQRYVAMVQKGLVCADAVIAPTAWMLGALAGSFDLPSRKTVIANGTSVAPRFDSPRPRRAVTAGRLWDEAKGLRLLEQIDSPIPIIVAGDDQMEGARVRLPADKYVPLGQLSREQMIALLESSAVYLCLSIYEPFGLAALEAARCGCAVVARDIPPLREVWEDAALFFDSGEALSEILNQLYRDPEFLLQARHQSHARAQHFTADSMTEQYLVLYKALLARSPRPQHVP